MSDLHADSSEEGSNSFFICRVRFVSSCLPLSRVEGTVPKPHSWGGLVHRSLFGVGEAAPRVPPGKASVSPTLGDAPSREGVMEPFYLPKAAVLLLHVFP